MDAPIVLSPFRKEDVSQRERRTGSLGLNVRLSCSFRRRRLGLQRTARTLALPIDLGRLRQTLHPVGRAEMHFRDLTKVLRPMFVDKQTRGLLDLGRSPFRQ